MYHHIKDFLSDWDYESNITSKLFQNLSDESLSKEIHPNVRTLGLLSWHMTHTIQEMMGKAGLKINIKEQLDYKNETVKEICDTYEQAAKLLVEALNKNWTDSDLVKEDEMYGDKWKRGTTLSILIRHQAHHRGEMVALMRIAGLPVIGAYGPTKEEWAQWGMEAMK